MIYLKKIIAQDLDRTPTFSQDSWQYFFKLPLENDENIILTFRDSKDNVDYICEIKRRATRNEIRAFIKDILGAYSAKVGDVIVFKETKESNIYIFTYLSLTSYNFDTLDIIFDKKNHQLLLTDEENTSNRSNFIGYNKIIYGAPGAGKSKSIIDLVGENYLRTVFHPETQYADFIGCLKPHKDHDGRITYGFRKGPFIQILEQALLNPDKSFFLVIEELNRANTAAVFGEIFQLLDRDENGQSEYPIFIQDEDLFNELKASGLSENPFIAKRELVIPSNLSIIATMNSSDQAVFPLDTAFKRRWTFEYLPIDFTKSANGSIPINDLGLPNVEWKKLAQAFNRVLLQLDVVEDKLIGPWFIKNSDLSDIKTAKETFIGKVCSYLWDDALKYKDKTKIFASNIKGYGQLYQDYMSGLPILSEDFVQDMIGDENSLEFGHESE
ncbi:McrB family protein [Wohlfahrtiimonas chitiniclastica]|uniref:McrB family protein n=1 Tax=Wohlfahrtiimonas chitiniclastica TaxID=400946 RepID=UPI001BD006C8|nr:AAA family ATPase [Wohlfahrtiimonas chitiniclastica]MBS7818990.1 AAA family ATPase [Wohlfahrtiimonas chitiniclastica]